MIASRATTVTLKLKTGTLVVDGRAPGVDLLCHCLFVAGPGDYV